MKYQALTHLSSAKTGELVAAPGEPVELTAEQAKVLLAAGAIENTPHKKELS